MKEKLYNIADWIYICYGIIGTIALSIMVPYVIYKGLTEPCKEQPKKTHHAPKCLDSINHPTVYQYSYRLNR